jgi:hypothetical protein
VAGKIAAATAVVVAAGAFVDAAVAFTTNSKTFTCSFGVPFPWCPGQIKRAVLTIPAADFVDAVNVSVASGETSLYGDVIMNGPPYNAQPNAAEWRIHAIGGRYRFEVEYASQDPRPVTVIVNNTVWRQSALNAVTGGFMPQSQRWVDLGELELKTGDNIEEMRA